MGSYYQMPRKMLLTTHKCSRKMKCCKFTLEQLIIRCALSAVVIFERQGEAVEYAWQCEKLCLEKSAFDPCIYSVFSQPNSCWWFSLNDWVGNQDDVHIANGLPMFTSYECILNEDATAVPTTHPTTSRPSSTPTTVK